MPRNPKTLEAELTSILNKHGESAFGATFDIGEYEDNDKLKEAAQKAFGETLSKASADISNAIERYLKTTTVSHVLASPTGPVNGIIQLL